MFSKPARLLPLADDEIQVWTAELRYPAEDMAGFAALLSPDEEARAEKFVFEHDRQRFIAGRGLLRILLGSYLGMEPARIAFNYGTQRKPALAAAKPDERLEFNLAHSQDLAVFAFCWNRQIGIDLEYIRSMPDVDDFAERFFSANETALLAALNGEEKTEAFFKIWTCKEAILKAIGSGLAKPLDQTEVAPKGDDSVRIERVDGDQAEAARWKLRTFRPGPGYQAALAGERSGWKLVLQNLKGNLDGPDPLR